MKRFSILCCLVLLLTVVCPVGHVHAESVTTPTDLCEHDWDSATGQCTLCDAPCSHQWGYWDDVDHCIYGCSVCRMVNKILAHRACCDDPSHCERCVYEGEIAYIVHCSNECKSFGAEGHGNICETCGEKTVTDHYAFCDDPTHCASCEYEGEIAEINHLYGEWQSFGEEGHGHACLSCGEKLISYHRASCDDPTHCSLCDYEGEIATIIHDYGEWQSLGDEGCGLVCKTCNHIVGSHHVWGNPVVENATETTNGRKTYTCRECGETKTETIPATGSEATPTPTAEPTAPITVSPSAVPEATATPTVEPEATVVPTVEPEATTVPTDSPQTAATAAEHTHTFGAYLLNGNGTHSHTCTACGEITTAGCIMADTTIGTMDVSACIYCGYLTWNLEDDADGQQQGQAVENAAFELLVVSGESLVTESMSLIVYASAPEVTVQLDESTTVVVKHALTISLLENDAPIDLEKAVKLSIPMEGDFTGLKLLAMNTDGELVEIEYEVMDGMLVFETDILGIFMLVEEI